ncbi:MAG TPA: hypothetical protein VIB47_00405, partial [Dehalococcoidia bacterium]
IHLEDELLGTGLTSEVEVPYYHGPVWPEAGHNAPALATFSGLACPSRLFIANPLEAERFEQSMSGRPAVLAPQGQHRAVLFSPHPEMGDLVRKWIALDGYVRKYLPIRGPKVMEETLRFYCPEDSQAFRLVLNAVARLRTFARARRDGADRRPTDSISGLVAVERLQSVVDQRMGELIADLNTQEEPWSRLVAGEAERVRGEAHSVFKRLRQAIELLGADADPQVTGELIRLSGEAQQAMQRSPDAPLVERLSFLELPIRLGAAAARLLEADVVVRRAKTQAGAVL